jgi:hypothetical protein
MVKFLVVVFHWLQNTFVDFVENRFKTDIQSNTFCDSYSLESTTTPQTVQLIDGSALSGVPTFRFPLPGSICILLANQISFWIHPTQDEFNIFVTNVKPLSIPTFKFLTHYVSHWF